MTTAFDVFREYCAMKAHFKSDYDYFKFNGKISAKPSSLERRNDKYYFSKLAKNKDFKEILLANFVENDNMWVGELIEVEAEDFYKSWKKRIESITYQYQKDLSKLDPDFNENFKVVDDNYPKLLTLFLRKDITLESMVILDKLVHFRKRWDCSIKEQYIWPDISKKIISYAPFLNINKEKMKKVTIDFFSNN